MVIDFVLIRREISAEIVFRMLYGGRAISGVYWYITCFLFTLFALGFLINHCSEKTVKRLILAGEGGIAVIESHLVDTIHLLQSPGIPWNLDVALIALVYVGIGYFHKDKIKKLLEAEAVRIDVVAGIIAVLMGIFCWVNYRDVSPFYYFDMKPVYYRELICAVPIPCAFDFVLVRTVHWLFNIAALGGFLDFVALCGRATIPIMFMHIPSNHWQSEFNYGKLIYVVIGVGVPVLFTLLFNRVQLMRSVFGIPNLKEIKGKNKNV